MDAQDEIRAQFNNLNTFLEEAVPVLTRMAANDYSMGIKGNYPGILGEAKTQINEIQDRINRVVAIIVDISNGDLSKIDAYRKIAKRSDADTIVPACQQDI